MSSPYWQYSETDVHEENGSFVFRTFPLCPESRPLASSNLQPSTAIQLQWWTEHKRGKLPSSELFPQTIKPESGCGDLLGWPSSGQLVWSDSSPGDWPTLSRPEQKHRKAGRAATEKRQQLPSSVHSPTPHTTPTSSRLLQGVLGSFAQGGQEERTRVYTIMPASYSKRLTAKQGIRRSKRG